MHMLPPSNFVKSQLKILVVYRKENFWGRTAQALQYINEFRLFEFDQSSVDGMNPLQILRAKQLENLKGMHLDVHWILKSHQFRRV